LGQLSPFVNVSTEMYHAINYEDIDEANWIRNDGKSASFV
jgi:hypothetical protein